MPPPNMTAREQQQKEFDRLVDRARRADLLKFCHEGIAVIELPSPPCPSAGAAPGAAPAASPSR